MMPPQVSSLLEEEELGLPRATQVVVACNQPSSMGCSCILKISFKLFTAGTACVTIEVAQMQIFRVTSQYLTDCTTLLLSHQAYYNGENVKDKKVAHKIFLSYPNPP